MSRQTTRQRTALAVVLASTCAAQQQLELQDLVKLADVAFHGGVTAIRNEAVPEKGTAFTHVTFAIHRVLIDRTGQGIGPDLELVFAGGQIGDRTIRVSHVPQFALGDEVVAFAQHDGLRYMSPVLGGEQGLLRIVRDRKTSTAYPLLVGERGIAAVVKGSLVPADRVSSIEDGRVQWRQPESRPGMVKAPLPTPVVGSGGGTASESTALAPNRPEHLANLDVVLAGIEALAKLPDQRSRRRAGR